MKLHFLILYIKYKSLKFIKKISIQILIISITAVTNRKLCVCMCGSECIYKEFKKTL